MVKKGDNKLLETQRLMLEWTHIKGCFKIYSTAELILNPDS